MFERKNALKFSWEDVSYGITKMLNVILGRKIGCVASTDEYDYWSVVLSERLSREELDKIFDYLKSDERERADTLPELLEEEDTVNSFGKELCEHLLKQVLHNDWEDSYCTKDTFWCLGTK